MNSQFDGVAITKIIAEGICKWNCQINYKQLLPKKILRNFQKKMPGGIAKEIFKEIAEKLPIRFVEGIPKEKNRYKIPMDLLMKFK